VWFIVAAVVFGGDTPDEFVESYPHLNLAQVYDALSYYYDHREEIDRDRAEQEAVWPE
jgi:uncharacterized protein (DUF433 family)